MYLIGTLLNVFLSSVGWSRDYRNEGFGEQNSIKSQLIHLMSSVRTLLRGEEDVFHVVCADGVE